MTERFSLDDDPAEPFATIKVKLSVYQRIREVALEEERSISSTVRRMVRAYDKSPKSKRGG